MNVPDSNPNLAQLAVAAEKLTPLLNQIVFVGGCVTGLLVTDPAAAPIRPTLDVDAIVAVASYAEYVALEKQLQELGFSPSLTEGAPICRWQHPSLILDLMPTDPSVLGFTNRWYGPAMVNAQRIEIEGHEIQIITAPYFVATKLQAFHTRGKNGFQSSHDLEDIVTINDGRAELPEEIRAASSEVRRYLSGEFQALLSNRDFIEALPGHLLSDAVSQQRLNLVTKRMQMIAAEE